MAKKHQRHQQQSTSSTELPHAVAWAEVGHELSRALSKAVGIPEREIKGLVVSEERIANALGDATGAELALLELILEAGGSISVDDVVRLAKLRCDMGPDKAEAACRQLEAKLLAGRFHKTTAWGARLSIMGILDVMAPVLVSRVLGISLPIFSPSPDLAGSIPPDPLRETIAILASAAHATVKTTQRFDVNRTSSRKVAAMLALPEPRVVEVLDAGIRAGMFDVREGVALPNVDALRALARRERDLDGSDDVELVRRLVPRDRWVAREAVVRAVVTTKSATIGSRAWLSAANAVALARLATIVHEGHDFVRLAESDVVKGGGDGHVTPSFEVMLGPRADPEILAVLALAAEPVRLDRVITLKLTPASISGAVSCGARIDDISRALDAVAHHHPVPDNVMTLVREWAERAKIVRVRIVWAADCSTKEAADAAAMALGEKVVARPTPTLLLVHDSTDPVRALAKSGVRVLSAAEDSSPRRHAPTAPMNPASTNDLRTAVLEARGDRSLAAKVAEARSTGFPIEMPMPRAIGLADSIAALRSRPDARSPSIRRFLDLLVAAANDSAGEFDRWVTNLPFDERTEVLAVLRDRPLDFMDWLATSPGTRRSICERSACFDDLIELTMTLPSTTQLARSLDDLLARFPDVRRFLDAGSTPYDDDDDDGIHEDEHDEDEWARDHDPEEEEEPVREQSSDEVRRRFTEAAEKKQALVLRVCSKTSGDRKVSITPERVIERGKETMLLGVDPETLENRSYPLRTVLAATVRD